MWAFPLTNDKHLEAEDTKVIRHGYGRRPAGNKRAFNQFMPITLVTLYLV